MINAVFDSSLEQYKKPFGAVSIGTEVEFSICIDKLARRAGIYLHFFKNEDFVSPALTVPMRLSKTELVCDWYSAKFTPSQPELLFYCFSIETSGQRYLIKKTDLSRGMVTNGGFHWQLTIYEPQPTPKCMEGIVYQIFPDRFKIGNDKIIDTPYLDRRINTNWGSMPNHTPDDDNIYRPCDYFGGNLQGIKEKLPYIKSLGTTAIYLNPIFEAHSNHRYNTADYMKIDPLLGTEQDFIDLCSEANNMDISVILDGVFSHTGSDSLYFNLEGRYEGGAYNDPKSVYRNWYKFDHYPNNYRSWWGFLTLPEVDEENKEFRNFICGKDGVVDYWMQRGASGFRLDVADELPDVILDEICDAVKRNNPHGIIIGEIWEDASNKQSYGQRRRYLLGKQLNSVMNYPFTDGILAYVRDGNWNMLRNNVLSVLENYPMPVVHCLLNSISTHDICRAITTLAGDEIDGRGRTWQAQASIPNQQQLESGIQMLKLASFMQYTLPGTPCLYYADETGAWGYKDPFNRGCYPWGNEDRELVEFFKEIGKLRENYPILKDGGFRFIYISEDRVTYQRFKGKKIVEIDINRKQLSYSIKQIKR